MPKSYVQQRPFAKIVPSGTPLLLPQLFLLINGALPQWKPMDENSCKHDVHPYASHWLNFYSKIHNMEENIICLKESYFL